MEKFYNRPISPRVLVALTVAAIAVVSLPLNGWLLLPLAPFVTHCIVGFRLTKRRVAWRACLMPSMLILPLVLALWIRSNQRMMYCLVSVGGNRFVGVYFFPGVVEAGVYEHDPAGLKYLREGITEGSAGVMIEEARRFQTFEGSPQVYDCVCFIPISPLPRYWDLRCRVVPVVDGWWSIGSVHSGLHGHGGWTPSRLYFNAGPWTPGLAYSSDYFGFHFLIPCAAAGVQYALGLLRWRRHEHRLQHGLCVGCGYDLTGNVSGACPECGKPTASANVCSPPADG